MIVRSKRRLKKNKFFHTHNLFNTFKGNHYKQLTLDIIIIYWLYMDNLVWNWNGLNIDILCLVYTRFFKFIV